MKKYLHILALALALSLLVASVPASYAYDITKTETNTVADATQVELAIAYGRSLIGNGSYNNYCQRFVRVCYEAAGVYGDGVSSAAEARSKWMISTSRDNIPVGATLYFDTGVYGHSAIYLGNNRMLHALSVVTEGEISQYFWSVYVGWGWQAGVKPTGTYINNDDVLNGSIWETTDVVTIYDEIGGNRVTRLEEGSKLSVSSITVTDGKTWGYAEYYSNEGYIDLEYCRYLYTIEGGAAQTFSESGKAVTGVTISQPPSKNTYHYGDCISTAGLKLCVSYSDGSTKTVSDGFGLYSPRAYGSGYASVLVGYAGKIVSYPVMIVLSASNIGTLPLKKAYKTCVSADYGCLMIDDAECSVDTVSEMFSSGFTVSVYTCDGEVRKSGLVATGDFVMLASQSGVYAVSLAKKGDINGDGRVSGVDTLISRRVSLGTYTLSGTLQYAALGFIPAKHAVVKADRLQACIE